MMMTMMFRGLTFLIWDVGGQEKIRPLWRSYTRYNFKVKTPFLFIRSDHLERCISSSIAWSF